MTENKENLEGIVLKLKEQGIKAGVEEKQRIIETATKQANDMLSLASSKSDAIIQEAKTNAAQLEKNVQAAMVQASRDMIEASKMAVLQYFKSVFGKQCDNLFTQKQYLEEILKVVVETIPGNKTVTLPAKLVQDMESFLLTQAFLEQIELKPLADNAAKIVVSSHETKGVQYVLSSQDVEEALFSLMNKDLVERITQKSEE
jgi:V/A-type H+-transporting ATPase subunit E